MIAAALLAAGVTFAAPPTAASFKWRGVLEGYFGRPWTWRQRARLVDWLPRHHFNLYAIGPKDDPELRARWREPLKEETKRELRALAARAKSRGVALAWTLSPGADVRPREEADIVAAVDKLAAVCEQGISMLTLAFDDAPALSGQAEFADEVRRRLLARCPAAQMTFVPAQYWGAAAPSDYLEEIAIQLDPAFTVAWTGPSVINRAISAEQAERYKNYVKHDLILGDNYPVQDRLVDAGRLFLGPLTGREPGLAAWNAGYLANATPLLEASLIPLATAGDYAWDPAHYDAATSWKKSIAEAGGSRGEKKLALLAGLCARSWLRAPEGNETEALERAFDRDGPALKARLRAIADLGRSFPAPPALTEEIRPWVDAAAAEARRALGDPKRYEGPAIVADQAFDRFFRGKERALTPLLRRYRLAGEERQAALTELDGLAAARDQTPDFGEELWPWPWILGRYAEAARDAANGRPWSRPRLTVLRWRARLRLLPAIFCRRLIDARIAAYEKRAGLTLSLRPLPPLERAYAAWRRAVAPSSWVARLSRPEEIAGALRDLSELARRYPYPPPCVEAAPWLWKISDYAAVGLAAEDLEPPLSPAQREAWSLRRERLASGNGLELLVELKLELEAVANGAKGELLFPPNPSAGF